MHGLGPGRGVMTVWVDFWSFPASGGSHSVLLKRFWHNQTMRTEKTRNWAYWNHGAGQRDQWLKEGRLTQRDVQWIMGEEDNETQLMKFCPATGGRPSRWLIRQGNYITLAELFVFGARRPCAQQHPEQQIQRGCSSGSHAPDPGALKPRDVGQRGATSCCERALGGWRDRPSSGIWCAAWGRALPL